MTTEILCFFEKKNLIKKIQLKGHTNFEVRGKDIVCAAISSITGGSINFLKLNFPKDFYFEINKKKTQITIYIKTRNKKENKTIQKHLKMMIFQLENIEKLYPENLKINFIFIIKKTTTENERLVI